MNENRYSINDLKVLDKNENPIKEIYIREILDSSSAEFKFSKLSAQQKIDIIDAVGLDILTDVLREYFKSKGENCIASVEAHSAYDKLCRDTGRSSNIGLVAQLESTRKIRELFKSKPVESLTIAELAAWSYSDSSCTLRLPPIQRSVVWNNEQVINYWDSLLRGYPAGMMMVHRVEFDVTSASSMARDFDGNTREVNKDDFELFDGQQRMTAVLLGLGKGQMSNGRKLWIDLVTPNASSNLSFQLRISSKGQPFGYRTDSPNQKIELSKRQAKWEEWRKQYGEDATPQTVFDSATGKDLINSSHAISFSEICNRILNESANVTIEYLSTLDGIDCEKVEKFVDALKNALNIPVVLQEVSHKIVADQVEYIRYFGRLGQGGTRLSDDELTYSIIKLSYPYIHDQMRKIMADGIGRIASEVDLVLAAIRVSKTLEPWEKAKEWEIIGRPNPKSVTQLHDKNAVERKFLELIPKGSETGLLETSLKNIRDTLTYDISDNPRGLPAMLLARLPHELIDVLILFAVKQGRHHSWEKDDRTMLCSFTLYWLFFVRNHEKAAWRAFQHVRNEGWFLGQVAIYRLISEYEEDDIAYFIPREDDLNKLQDEVMCEVVKEGYILHSWVDRFKAADLDRDRKPGEALRVLSTNRELIQRALMWLQRGYITENYSNYDPTSDRDDDLPIDLDHIIPHDLFGFHWTDKTNRLHQDINTDDAISANFRWQRELVGNSLGNFRWLDSRKNRARGKAAFEPLENNADLVTNPGEWNKIIPNDLKKQSWTKENISTFQRLIDLRTLFLYKKILTESGIEKILKPETVDNKCDI
ncbi:MAG: DUF262 domain-containing protein [Methylococcaceae bacterium]|nr:DUF262 domain-containing protein [Methylococcaceae bacterium]